MAGCSKRHKDKANQQQDPYGCPKRAWADRQLVPPPPHRQSHEPIGHRPAVVIHLGIDLRDLLGANATWVLQQLGSSKDRMVFCRRRVPLAMRPLLVRTPRLHH